MCDAGCGEKLLLRANMGLVVDVDVANGRSINEGALKGRAIYALEQPEVSNVAGRSGWF